MSENIAEEVQEVLENESNGIALEDVPNEQSSPLNEAVKEKDIAGATSTSGTSTMDANKENTNPPEDAPEQEIGNDEGYAFMPQEEEDYSIPKSTAGIAADAILGSVNNYIGVGAGFFIRIKKHKDFYDFEDIVRIVDDQNEKNIQRIKFDDEDLALLRPLLIQVIQKRAKNLTPEQQLLSVLLSIMVKKAQVVMQIRFENELLTERILDIIREEKAASTEKRETANPPTEDSESEPEVVTDMHREMSEAHHQESPIEAQILEVASEDELSQPVDE